MTTNKNVSSTSMLDFKAEFLKKKQDFQSKLTNNSSDSKTKIISTPLQNLKGEVTVSKQPSSNHKLSQNNKKINTISDHIEDDARLELSRRKLIEKSKLYESLQKEFPKSKEDEDCLVDFEKKSYEQRYESGDDDIIDSSNHLKESNWIEFTDSLGRVRKCLPEDLEEYKRRDKELQSDKVEFNSDDKVSRDVSHDDDDDYMSKDIKDVRYEDLRENEIRTHGVGFYSFSIDKTEREEQLSQLQELHRQTEQNRAKTADNNAKRKLLLQKRLEQVRINRGLPAAPAAVVKENDDSTTTTTTVNLDCDPSTESNPLNATDTDSQQPPPVQSISESADLKRPAQRPPMREWDRGKSIKLMSQEDYVERERNRRDSAFAPPSIYKT